MDVQPVTLETHIVRLEPLTESHAPALLEAGREDRIWQFMPYHPNGPLDEMRAWVRTALDKQAAGVHLPFVVHHKHDGLIVGSTRYLEIDRNNRSVEIGSSWLRPDYWRTPVNTHCKYLLLRHAFETLGAIRVWFKTDSRNLQSQRAIERLGAAKEGVLRNHMILPDGYFRASVVYSIMEEEWEGVKERLEEKMAAATGIFATLP